MIDLLNYYQREAEGPKLKVLSSSLISGVSRGLLLAIINMALENLSDSAMYPVYVLAFIAALLLYISTNYYALTRTRMLMDNTIKKMRVRMVNKLLLTDLHFIEKKGDDSIYVLLTQDLNQLGEGALTFITAFEALILVLFTLAYIGWLSPIGLLVTLITIFAGVGAYLYQNQQATENNRQLHKKRIDFFGSIGDSLHGFKELKINRSKNNAINEHVADNASSYCDLSIKTEKLYILSFLTTQTFMFIMIGILVFILPLMDDLNTTLMFQFLAAILFLMGPLEMVVDSFPNITRANVALENLQRLETELDDTIARDENRDKHPQAMRFNRVEMRDIQFDFQAAQSDDAFKLGPLNFDFQQGEILFLVGGNGSGKTTLIKLLTGLYLPTSGAITVDGKAVSMQEYQAYREMFSAIFGDFHLFNKLYGIDDFDLEHLKSLLKALELHNKTHYEYGAFTTISLSTGQRKRLAYTIAMLEQKQIYIFDEFAADQDPGFRRLFYQQLLPELKAMGKTVIAVTHDDNYFDSCDRLVKIDYGQIVYNGPPQGLGERA